MKLCGYATLSRNSSAAFPMCCSRSDLRHRQIRMGDVPASAEIWCFTMQSFAPGLRIPGQPSHAE